jgi:hypothetical protein
VWGQNPGQNVNMVSGTKWPGGDPFLQRQNEPSLAVSTRNPLHLLAGANDYRSVDIPNPNSPDERGDAWLGVFKSFDGGATWGSTLLPGYPQDTSAAGVASPLHGFATAADPVVRAGTNGLFYYSGIAFNRSTNLGQIFVSRYMDLNNQEGGDASQSLDPIRYINTVTVDSGTSGQFLDKPWIAVDIPRGTATCTLRVPQGGTTVTQVVPAGNVYAVWSRFTGSTSTKIMFSVSQDCGATWSAPTKLSESNSINQGTTMAIDPRTGNIYVAWRRFVTSSQPDAIVGVVSTNLGKSFSKSVDIVDLPVFNSATPNAPSFFDQETASAAFRTHSFPTLGVDSKGIVYLAWSQRGLPTATGGDARIAMATSMDGVNWSTPFAIDNGPLVENGQPVLDSAGNPLARGHQAMPQISIAGSKLFVLYYDLREDHTAGLYLPDFPFAPDANGNFYQESRQLLGELPGNPNQVFTPALTDANLTLRRHTIDLVTAQADTSAASLVFTAARVSRYNFGLRNDSGDVPGYLRQLQVDPPNLPLFEQGQVPFLGDYIDIAGLAFVPTDTTGKNWRFSNLPSDTPVVYATWTSNQDVRPPADGNWQNYTPVGGGGPSIYSPGTNTPVCSTGQEGMRNQNIYSSRITQGLLVSVPQNAKPLSTTLQRSFIVLIQNFTNFNKTFRLAISNQPPGGRASFIAVPNVPIPNPLPALTPADTTFDVAIAAHTGASRPVFVLSNNPTASITINVTEISGIGGTPVSGGLSSFAVLNPDPTAPALINPNGNPAGNVSSIEIYDTNISNTNISNTNISNTNISNTNISNTNISNTNISNTNISNPDIAALNISNTNISNTNISNTNISNTNISNTNISNATITDATYTVTNNGNTTGSYAVKIVGNQPANSNLQLIVTKIYQTPTNVGCQLALQAQNIPVTNVPAPPVNPVTTAFLTNPTLNDPTVTNSTLTLAPGESALVTLRGNIDPATLQSISTSLVPAVTEHSADTNSNTSQFSMPLLISIGTLSGGTVGVPYNSSLQAFGGNAPYTWSISLGTLPAGLTLNTATGAVTGTPTTAGTFTFTAQAVDSSTTPKSATRVVTMVVAQGSTTTAISALPTSSVFGQQVTLTATVNVSGGTPTGNVTFSDGPNVLGTAALTSGGTAVLQTSSLAVGSHSFSASYLGDLNFLPSGSPFLTFSVSQASSATILSSSPTTDVFGQPLTLTATVSAISPGAGTPTGTVTFTDGANILGTPILNGGTAQITISTLSTGNHSFNASYAGDTNFTGSSPATVLTQTINPATTAVSLTSSTNPSVFGQAVTFSTIVSVVAPGAGTPTGNVTFSDGQTALGAVQLTAGAASFTTASLTAGSHSITVSYAGNGSFAPNSSKALTQTVNPATTATSLTSSANPSAFGQAVTFSTIVSVVAPGAGIPSGIVTFRDGATTLGTMPLTAGTASFTTSSLAVGSHSITASYASNGNFSASASAALAQAVNKASTSTSISSISPNPVVAGQPVTVSFNVAVVAPGIGVPTGTVTVSDGAGATCTAALPATTCSLTSTTTGLHTLTATYSGDGNFAGSSGTSSVQETVTYVFTGFFSPIAAAGTFSAPSFSGTANLGNAVPIKWSLQNATGNYISSLSTTTLLEAIANPSCSGAPTGNAIVLYSPTTGAKGGSTFKFSTNQFVFNWDTSTGVTPGCFTVVLFLSDGSPAKATTIQLK